MQRTSGYAHDTGEKVVYRKQGIYEITDIKEQRIGNIKKDYYVLSSVYDKNASVYIPVDNEALTMLMEPILSENEIHLIIDNSENVDVVWIENTSERAKYFDEILKSGDLRCILAMLKLFMQRKENSSLKPFRNFARDEKAFSAAMKMVTEAFAYPLGLDKTQVISYISKRLSKNT